MHTVCPSCTGGETASDARPPSFRNAVAIGGVTEHLEGLQAPADANENTRLDPRSGGL